MRRAILVGGLVLLASGAAAQSPVRPVLHSRVTVDVVQLRPDNFEDLVRLAQPAGDPETWVTTADHSADMQASGGRTTLMLTANIDAQGAMTGCVPSSHDPQVLAQRVCTMIRQRARFTPALAANGERRAGDLRVFVDFEMISERTIAPGGLASMPPPPPPPGWPPSYPGWGVRVVQEPRFNPRVPRAERQSWTGETGIELIVNDAGEVAECNVRQSSGIAGMDEAGCEGLRAGSYAIPRPAAYRNGRNSIDYLIVWSQARAQALPATSRPTRARVDPAAQARLSAELRAAHPNVRGGPTGLEMGVDSTGRSTSCFVMTSTGNDSLDIAICEAARRTAGLIVPGSDVFGRPVAGRTADIDVTWVENPGQQP